MDINKALSIIEKAKMENGDSLDFSNMGITDEDLQYLLPKIIKELPNLEYLYLDQNQLTSIPDGIAGLVNLKNLHLDYNQLTTVPDSIRSLVNLEFLYLDQNQLTSIPDGIGNLVNLKRLGLANNQLTSVPDIISKLKKLNFLDLEHNQLTSIPEEIGDLVNLKRLSLSNNRLATVPQGIKNMGNLEFLLLCKNQLTSIPNGIGNLTNLRNLDVSHNQITQLPVTLNIYTNSTNTINLTHNPLTTETINWITTSDDLRRIISFDMAAHITVGNHIKVLDRIYGNRSKEIQNRINTLTKDYTVSNGNRSFLKTGTHVVKDFLEKTASNSLPTSILDVVIKHYVEKALSDDEIAKDTALTEMAMALGNCATPVYSLILNKAIGLAQEAPTLFKDQPLEAMLERMALEAYLTKHFKPLKNPKLNEYIEKLNGFLNSVYLEGAEDAEKYPDNKIKISGERTRLAPISANVEFAFTQIHTDWVEHFAKICCQTDEAGVLKKGDNQKYILDKHKLDVIKQQFMDDNNLGDSNIRVVLADFNKKCEEELNRYAELVANMSSLSEEHKNMLTPNRNELNAMLANKKEGETTEKIVDNCFKTYINNIEKVLQSKDYKKYILNNMLEDLKKEKRFEYLKHPIIERKTSKPNTERTQQAQARKTRKSSLSF